MRRDIYATVPKGESPEHSWRILFSSPQSWPRERFYPTIRHWMFTGEVILLPGASPTRRENRHAPRLQSNSYLGVKFPKVLVDAGKELVETEVLDRQGQSLRVTTLEAHPGGISGSAWTFPAGGRRFGVPSKPSVFPEAGQGCELHTLLLDNATVAAKVGFFLEKLRESLFVTEDHLAPLRDHRPKQPPLPGAIPSRGSL